MISALLSSPHSLTEDQSSNLIRARDALEELHSITGDSISGEELRGKASGAVRIPDSSQGVESGLPSTSEPIGAHARPHAADNGMTRKKAKHGESPVVLDEKGNRAGKAVEALAVKSGKGKRKALPSDKSEASAPPSQGMEEEQGRGEDVRRRKKIKGDNEDGHHLLGNGVDEHQGHRVGKDKKNRKDKKGER